MAIAPFLRDDALTDFIASFQPSTLPAHAEALREPVRAFLREHLPQQPADVQARSWMGWDLAFTRRLAERGWVGLTLPREWGGAGLDAASRFVVVEELLCASAPVGAHWIADRQSGPLIHRFGSELQKQRYLPGICAGELFFCIGMSEPDAGSDLAGVRTRATRIDGGWRLNGRKVWTSGAHRAHCMIALVRTSGSTEDRHVGLSQFIVELATPGITVRPIPELTGDAHFNEVTFDDVLLSDDALIGSEGAGWAQVNAELAFERSGPERLYSSIALLEHWTRALRQKPLAARRPCDVRLLGRLVAHLATLRGLSLSVTAALLRGESPLLQAALVKDLGTSFEQAIPRLIEDALGAEPDAPVPAELWCALSFVAQVAPTYSLRGGTREILRGQIARGLGLR